VSVGVLQDRRIWSLAVAEFVSHAGTQITSMVLPWFVLTTTGSAARMGLVMAAQLGSAVLFGIPGGAVVQRLGARRAMLLSDAIRAGVVVAVAALHACGLLRFGALIALVAALGVFFAPYVAAQRAIIPDLIGEEESRVGQANALLQGAMRLAGFVGPAAGGLLLAAFAPWVALFVDAATYLAAAGLIALFVRGAARPPDASAAPAGAWEGARFLLRDPFVGPVMGGLAVGELAFQALMAALPVMVLRRYDGDPRLLGMFLSAFGAGAAAGTAVVVHVLKRVRPLLLAGVALAVSPPCLWLLVIDLPPAGVAAVMATIGLASPFVNAPLFAWLTVRLPRRLRVQGLAAPMILLLLAGPVGLASVGPLLEAVGPRAVLVAIATLGTLGYVPASWLSLRHSRRHER
jgi:MFS family permease